MKLSFFGATREVTGSNLLVEAEKFKLLLECGFFQGSEMAEQRNFAPFSYPPETIDAIILCHAHLDHTGRIPKLFKDGFRGKIYSTAPTKELARLVLEDSLKLMEEDARRGKKNGILYSQKDVDGVMELFECIEYHSRLEIGPNIYLTFGNAGHILGSCIAILEIEGKKLVYSSDLGNSPSELLDSPDTISEADYVICESTYGGRVHEDASKRQEKLNKIIDTTVANNAVLMIPSFAIERTQELLHDIEHYCQSGNCALPSFFLDSPLAEKVTSVFEKYPEFLNKEINGERVDGEPFALGRVKMTSTVEQSKSIENVRGPKIIIAGSGMINGGRILHHLKNYISDSNNTLLIVGYVAKGTLGRRLFDGDKKVKIFGKSYDVLCTIKAIGSYSAHADSKQIMNWLSKIKKVKRIFLVHGEVEESMALSKTIKKDLGIEVDIPQQGESYTL